MRVVQHSLRAFSASPDATIFRQQCVEFHGFFVKIGRQFDDFGMVLELFVLIFPMKWLEWLDGHHLWRQFHEVGPMSRS